MRVTDGVDEQPRQVDRFGIERPAGAQPGEQKEVFDQAGHPDCFGLHPTKGVRDVRGKRLWAAPGQFGIPTDRRQWRP